MEVTWSAVPQEQQTNISEQPAQTPQYGQNTYPYPYTNPFDMFDYFFGNGMFG